ncbi:MAG TPA: RsmE family RNA methyltransferase [Acidimicrobiales bacterium]|nr:RsmE family RNA methyltransferase [Acidimicrobiales bacterium]
MGEGADGVAVRAAASAQVFVEDPTTPVLGPGDLHHLATVLRLRRDEEVVASNGQGAWCLCRFRGPGSTERDALESDGHLRTEAREGHPVVVAFAPVKGDRPEWVVQKLTELGVDRIVALVADRSVVRWEGERAVRSMARLGRTAVEAAAQSRRVWLPELPAPHRLREAAAAFPGLALAERGGAAPAASLSGLAVGPEGGWSPEERALGLETVGLGQNVLRAETAAVAAGVVLCVTRAARRS